MSKFQNDVKRWAHACFGKEIAEDKVERNHRFIEEAMELVQSLGCTREEALDVLEYTYDRPKGEPTQEVGGVMVTLAALCAANEIYMVECGEVELDRITQPYIMDKIRMKQAAKPKFSARPIADTSKPK